MVANRIEPFIVTVPAGTSQSAPQETPLRFNDGKVVRLEITVPPGPSGHLGFKVAHSGQAVIPPVRDVWNVVDNHRFDWDMQLYPWGGSWELWAYNTGAFAHSVYLWFHVSDVSDAIPLNPAPLSIAPGTSDSTESEQIVV